MAVMAAPIREQWAQGIGYYHEYRVVRLLAATVLVFFNWLFVIDEDVFGGSKLACQRDGCKNR